MRLRQFSLRHLFASVGLIAMMLGYGGWIYRRAAEQDAAIAAVQDVGGRVELAYRGSDWLDRIGGHRLRRYVIGLTFADSESDLQNDVLINLNKFPSLQWLDFDLMQVDEYSLRYAARLGELRRVNLNNSSITAAGVAHLTGLHHLERVWKLRSCV